MAYVLCRRGSKQFIKLSEEGGKSMSYYRFNSEIIKVKNENLNTRAFLESVQRYIMDLMNGVRIESLGKLSIDVYLDDLHI